MKTVHLGYEVGTGKPVAIPLRNLAVTGQTQESGKTTTLEALAIRADARVLTFVTKRGEGSFAEGRRVQPYFRDRADWQFVDALLAAQLGEKNKFLRSWIIKICRDTQTLAQVHAEVKRALVKAKGINEGVYTQLDAYLELIVPEIKRARLAETLDLQPGLNVMDVSGFDTPMQMLFVQSAIDFVNEHYRDTIIVVPEAWEFIPEGKGSPVKESAITLVRKGSGIGNRIWVDSQDMAGVDKVILRGCPVWLIGVQREINEIKRNLANIPVPVGKPKAADVAMLERGQFFVCFGSTLKKVYVQPAWMPEQEARAIALGTGRVESAPKPQPVMMNLPPVDITTHELGGRGVPARPFIKAKQEDDEVTKAEADALRAENEGLKEAIKSAERETKERVEDAYHRGFEQCAKRAQLTLGSLREIIEGTILDLEPRIGKTEPAGKPVDTLKPIAPPPRAREAAPARPEKDDGQDSPPEPNAGALKMLDALVRSAPHGVPPQIWGVAAGRSPVSGPWHSAVKSLKAAGFVEADGGRFKATVAGIGRSSAEPSRVSNDVELWALWAVEIAEEVGKVLTAAGGKWNRGAKGHVFDGPASDAIEPVLLTGEVTNKKQEFGQFFTPPNIVQMIVTAAGIRPGMQVLEPSAGRGAIAFAAAAAGAEVMCYEADEPTIDALVKENGKSEHRLDMAVLTDFLTVEPTAKFDAVVMNPPFAKRADIHHVNHAFSFLKPGGRLVAIMSAGIEFRSDKLTVTFREKIESLGGTIERLPEDSFKASGTSVNTVIVTADV